MSIEENKAIVSRATEEIFNKNNLAVVDELYATNFVSHGSDIPGVTPDREGYKQFVTMSRTALPDFHTTIEDMIAEGDKVVQRFTARGTHKGEFMGIPPTGKQVTITGIAIDRIAGGKIVENWVNIDMLGMMVQLGVVPPPG
jgi:steroid delta-isomerase-like uncharacterized protein